MSLVAVSIDLKELSYGWNIRDIKVNEAADNYKHSYLKAYAFMDKLKQNVFIV